jgi:hypothetical protein
MRRYDITITGSTPLLMHPDNIEWADRLEAWKNDPGNKRESKAGDDRSPAWRWIGNLYSDGRLVALPSDNLMRAFMEGGAMVPVPGGKSGKTFKAQSQSGMMVAEPYWPIDIKGANVKISDIQPLMEVKDFALHKARATELGFRLHVKRAKIGASKHIRVRPMFETWSAHGTINVWDEQITDRVLADILSYAGQYKGLGDWRPGGRTPGSFGMFTAQIREG